MKHLRKRWNRYRKGLLLALACLLTVSVLAPAGPSALAAVTPGEVEEVWLTGDSSRIIADKAGSHWIWGQNTYGKFGLGSELANDEVVTPVELEGSFNGIAKFSDGGQHSLLLDRDGQVWSAGNNFNRVLGVGEEVAESAEWIPVKGRGGSGTLTGVRDISATYSYSVALMEDGTVLHWGRLPLVGNIDYPTPVYGTDATPLTGVQAIVSSQKSGYENGFTMALKDDGTVVVWGWDNSGVGMVGGSRQSMNAVPIGALEQITQVAIGQYHALVLREDGTVWAWGRNNYGQLGNGTRTHTSEPVQVTDEEGQPITGAVQVAASLGNSYILKADGSVWAIGNRDHLGAGFLSANALHPVQVNDASGRGYVSDIRSIDAKDDSVIAVGGDGSLWGWGRNAPNRNSFRWINDTNIDIFRIPVRMSIGGAPLDGSAKDETPPQMATVSPTDGATGVAADAQVSITFDEPVSILPIAHNLVKVRDGQDQEIRSSLYFGSQPGQVLFHISESFQDEETYTVTVPAGVIQDYAGNTNESELVWSFSTTMMTAQPDADKLFFNNVNPQQAAVTGDTGAVTAEAEVLVYSDANRNNLITQGRADETGAFELTFDNSFNKWTIVYVTAKVEGMMESDPVALHVDRSDKPDVTKLIFNNSLPEQAVLTGESGAVAENADVKVYRYNSGDALITTQKANEDGSFVITIDADDVNQDRIYVSAAEEGRMESERVEVQAVEQTDKPNADKLRFSNSQPEQALLIGEEDAVVANAELKVYADAERKQILAETTADDSGAFSVEFDNSDNPSANTVYVTATLGIRAESEAVEVRATVEDTALVRLYRPDTGIVKPGEPFRVRVSLDAYNALYGVQIAVQYDPELLRPVDLDESRPGVQALTGDLFAEHDFRELYNDTYGSEGTFIYAATLIGEEQGLFGGASDVFELAFEPLTEGEATISLQESGVHLAGHPDLNEYRLPFDWSVREIAVMVEQPSETDTEAPQWPEESRLEAKDTGRTNLTLEWTPAQDNVAVTGYKVYRDGTEIATVTSTAYEATGLAPGTTYTFRVEAVDAAGNESAGGPEITVTTLGEPGETDTEAPQWPSGSRLEAKDIGRTALTLEWTAAQDNVAVTGYKVYRDGAEMATVTSAVYDVTGLAAGTTYTFRVEAVDAAGNESIGGPETTVTTQRSQQGGGGSSGGGSGGSRGGNNSSEQPVSDTFYEEITNGIRFMDDALTFSETEIDGKAGILVIVDEEVLEEALVHLGGSGGQYVVVDAGQRESTVRLQLPADVLDRRSDAAVSFRSGSLRYDLPLAALDYTQWADDFDADLDDMRILVTMERVTGEEADAIRQDLNLDESELLSDVVRFTVIVEVNGEQREVNDFNGVMVVRMIEIDAGADPDRSTGVRFEAGGPVFVPTVFERNGTTLTAVIMSDSNSLYGVVESDRTFTDIQNHWAQEEVERLASKLVVNGVDVSRFAPDQKVTRAEFTTLLVRALGLSGRTSDVRFTDVDPSDWYYDAVSAAAQAGLVSGDGNGAFLPQQELSREQMAVMMARALDVAGVAVSATDRVISDYRDADQISSWARESMSRVVQTGIIGGTGAGDLAPAQSANRAQAAVMLDRLLRYIGYING